MWHICFYCHFYFSNETQGGKRGPKVAPLQSFDSLISSRSVGTAHRKEYSAAQPAGNVLRPSHLSVPHIFLTRPLLSALGINCFSTSFTSVGTLPVWVSGSLEGSGAALRRKWQTVKCERAIPSTCSLLPGAARGCQLASLWAQAGLCTTVLSKPIYGPASLRVCSKLPQHQQVSDMALRWKWIKRERLWGMVKSPQKISSRWKQITMTFFFLVFYAIH